MTLLLLFACSGGDPPSTPTPTGSVVPAELVAASWQVRLAPAAARAAYEGREGWVAYYENRRADALRAFTAEGDKAAAARVHAEYAAAYRAAAMLGGQAAVQVWGVDAQPTDPAEVAHVVGVAGALVGDPQARARLGESQGAPDATLAGRDRAWAGWNATAPWPPAPVLPVTDPGPLPDPGPAAPYVARERTPEALEVRLPELGSLWSLAAWHEQQALAGPPEVAAVVPTFLDPWRLPPESAVGPVEAPVPDTLLFLSPFASGADLAFAAELAVLPQSLASLETALEDWAPQSIHATIVRACLKPWPENPAKQRVDTDCVGDAAAGLVRALQDGMAAANAGQPEAFHRPFAEYARLGVLMAAESAARLMLDPLQEGRFRLLAFDRATDNLRDPLFLLGVAAADAGNRYTLRAVDIAHELAPQVPGLGIARVPLDALHVRVSRSAAPGRPMH